MEYYLNYFKESNDSYKNHLSREDLNEFLAIKETEMSVIMGNIVFKQKIGEHEDVLNYLDSLEDFISETRHQVSKSIFYELEPLGSDEVETIDFEDFMNVEICEN